MPWNKLRVVLEKLQKYHFWILCGLIVLLAVGVWFLATTNRASAYATAKTKIQGEIDSTESAGIKQDQPNEDFIQALVIRITGDMKDKSEKAIQLASIKSGSDSLAGNVSSAATRLFDDQGKGNPLPDIFADKDQQTDFEKQFKKVWNHRMEEIEKPPAEAAADYVLAPQFRDRYRDRIKDIFPQLFDMIELRSTDQNDNSAGGGGHIGRAAAEGFARNGADIAAQPKGVVDWPDAKNLMGYFHNWNDTPSTLDVMLAQEDLWVYEALLRVIRNTNDMDPKHEKYKSPDTQAKARIKAIEALEIGSNAAQNWVASENAVFTFSEGGGAAIAGAGGRAMSGPGSMGQSGMGFMGKGMGRSSGTAGSALAGRYVDDTGKPLDDLAQDPNKEFRMMPIDMRLMIEQKEIPRLLVECANSSMRIDVRSVRILAEKPGPFDPNGSSSTSGDTGGCRSQPRSRYGKGGRGQRARLYAAHHGAATAYRRHRQPDQRRQQHL